MKAFLDFTHVALDLTKYYANDFSDRDFYTVFDCEAVLADSGKKVELRTGTKLKIISIGNELKFYHDFDRNEYEDKINVIIYYDYLCEFTLDGKKYKGNVPGIYVSTDVKELIVGDGAKYFTEYELSLWLLHQLLCFIEILWPVTVLKKLIMELKQMARLYVLWRIS